MRGEGRVYWRGKRVWIEYWVRGKQFREPAGKTEPEGRRKLKKRLQEIHGGQFVGPQQEKVAVAEVLDNLVMHLETRGAKSVRSMGYHLNPIRERFGFMRVADLTTAGIEQFIKERLDEGRASATINRETGALKQALNLARKRGVISPASIPYIPMLKEDNARQGFFEQEEFDAVVKHLPAPINDIVRFGYHSGWRKGEILPLRWDAVDRRAREVRLATSKNGRGRVLPLVDDLWGLIQRRWAAREYARPGGTVGLSAYVFHRKGRPYKDITKSWNAACKSADATGKLFHDLRRTAVRNMIRAGVPQAVAMAISGHRTVSMFIRYNVSSEDDKREALRATQRHLRGLPKENRVQNFENKRQK